MHHRTKHIEVKHYYVRGAQQKGEVKIVYLETENQLGDGLTKGLHRPRFEKLWGRFRITKLESAQLLHVNNFFLVSKRTKRLWIRKPLGSPIAKSKLFRIPQKPNLPEDEKSEIKRLYDNYKNEMKSLRLYFFDQSLKQAYSGEVAQVKCRLEEEEHHKLMMENQEQNLKIDMLRKRRLDKEVKQTREEILSSLIVEEKEKVTLANQLEFFLDHQKKLPFIDPANIEREIETALSNAVDLNYAIDLDGYMYKGNQNEKSRITDNQLEKLSSNS
uniref:Small ribosomal subunit protein mS26 n=1 Tax=Scapholeberis mucronata TaxID=202097 RepID=A0A4Y7NL19_9CRUS|nr:EOG090X0FQ9 [Scapholeberis mucronata]SVE93941.1 EOG090X0FQ9 [Scapholeberis mucronata]